MQRSDLSGSLLDRQRALENISWILEGADRQGLPEDNNKRKEYTW